MRVVECGRPGAPDAAAWDALVSCDPRGHLLQTWAWGELKAAYGWRPLRLAVERDGALVAGAQVLFRALGPLSIAYIPTGPALDPADSEAAHALLRAVHAASRRRRALYLKVEPEWPDARRGHPGSPGATWPQPETVQPRRTIAVNLEGDEEGLLARMKSKWRYNIRLAAQGWRSARWRATTSPRAGGLLPPDGRHRERDGFGIHTEDYYRRALDLCPSGGPRSCSPTMRSPSPADALCVQRLGLVHVRGLVDAHRERMQPPPAVEAMRWARTRGCRCYDLWGIPDADAEEDAGRRTWAAWGASRPALAAGGALRGRLRPRLCAARPAAGPGGLGVLRRGRGPLTGLSPSGRSTLRPVPGPGPATRRAPRRGPRSRRPRSPSRRCAPRAPPGSQPSRSAGR